MLTPRQSELLNIVLSAGEPLSVNVIAERFGTTPGNAAERLRVLRNKGLVATTKVGGQGAKWAHKDLADRMRADLAATLAAERSPKALSAERQARRAREDAAFARWVDQTVQSIVPAVECKPPKTRAVNSVFALAQIA